MSYVESFKIGWSILWRQCAWVAALAVAVWAVGRSALAVAIPALVLFCLPLTIRRLTRITYSDFHLSVGRPDGSTSNFTYIEALALSLAICLANAFLAGPLAWVLRQTYQYFLLAFYPIFVAGPIAAFVLAYFPVSRFELQILHNSWLPGIHDSI